MCSCLLSILGLYFLGSSSENCLCILGYRLSPNGQLEQFSHSTLVFLSSLQGLPLNRETCDTSMHVYNMYEVCERLF